MNRKLVCSAIILVLGVSLSGCGQVHFGKNSVIIGEIKTVKKKNATQKSKPVKKLTVQSSSSKKPIKKVATKWNEKKTKRLKKLLNAWSKKSGQEYSFYDGRTALKTKKGATYPAVFTHRKFILKKKQVELGYSPLGVNKYQYNVLAIANDNFKSWHNTYLFCIKAGKPIILLDQSKNTNPIIVRIVNDKKLNQGFKQIYKN